MNRQVIAIKAEVYSRVVGFYRPVESWNKGKQSEYHDRHQQTVEQMQEAVRGDASDGS